MTALYIKTYSRDNEPLFWVAMWDFNYLFFIHHGHAMICGKTCLEALSKTNEGVGNGELKWHRSRWKWSCTTSQERWSHTHCHNNGCHRHCHKLHQNSPQNHFYDSLNSIARSFNLLYYNTRYSFLHSLILTTKTTTIYNTIT